MTRPKHWLLIVVVSLSLLFAGCGSPSSPIPDEPTDSWYRMRTATDCGPAAVAFVAQVPYSQVRAAWGWPNYGDERDNLWDIPTMHFKVLKKLGVPFRQVTGDDIVAGRAKDNQTVVLMHAVEHPILWQHWTVLVRVTDTHVTLAFGDSEIPRTMTHQSFLNRFYDGAPACAYVVDR